LPLIDRYLLRETFRPFVSALFLVVLTVFLMQLRRLAQAALGFGLTTFDALAIMGSTLAPFLVLAIPIAYLLSVLVALGRLSGDQEILALRAAGCSPLRVARSPVVLGALVACLSLPIAIYGEPYSLKFLRRRLVEVGMRNLTQAIQPGTFNESFRGSALYARSRTDSGDLEEVLVYDEKEENGSILITAQTGRLTAEAQSHVNMHLRSGEMHLGLASDPNRYDRIRFQTADLGLEATDELFRQADWISSLGQLTNPEMRALVAEHGQESPFTRRIEKMLLRRFAFPSMALVFAVVGCAIALSSRPKSRIRNTLLGIACVVAYYALTRAGDLTAVRYQGVTQLAVWGPNALLLGVGMVGLLRTGGPKR
jgi:lipopolysaccharide export system permease protein